MDWVWYLFRFNGRINRAKFWLGGLIIVCWMVFLAALLIALGLGGGKGTSFGFNVEDIFRALDPDTYKSLTAGQIPTLLVKAGGTALFTWVYLAISIKRLHDRDRSAWWMIPFFVVPGLINQFADRLPESVYAYSIAGAIAIALYIWAFIELACLSGTRHPNLYGPNPLGKVQGRPRDDRDNRPRTAQGWDQQSEIEIVPHKAGPPPVWRVKRGA
ncbi:DUF805 domain-containing protein [Bradyrhizobium tropiciagri]|uniref:DUF805 domain-containing protein n=1 Tax=Bradyrhizobium tropiciagri TaxID=312253 RepID=UPI001BA600A5|nr:DUF805 domain-containing protein [Bradyrhizobium tropiciagri]MBR0869777.1 DUF805 domain-containing protein [Bradyrhizobium tropiciagri]